MLSLLRDALNLTSDVLLFLLAVVAVALVGGLWPALAAAVAGLAAAQLLLHRADPIGSRSPSENIALALVVFIAVAAMVSAVVDLAARRSSQAARSTRRGRDTVHRWPVTCCAASPPLTALLDQVQGDASG